MPALLYHGSGEITFEDVPLGPVDDGHVAVDMRYAGLNPLDVRLCRGVMDRGLGLPFVPGTEGAGTLSGKPVLVYGAGVGTTQPGTFQTSAVVPRGAVHALPEDFDLITAAALGTAGVTAWDLVNTVTRVSKDDEVLVLGAAGGVGTVAVQLAAATGASVLAQTSHSEKAERLEAMGATPVLADDPDRLVTALGAARPTIVLDALGGDFTGAALRRIRPGGVIAVFGVSGGAAGTIDLLTLYRKAVTVQGYASMAQSVEQVGRTIQILIDMVTSGVISVPIHDVVPIRRAEDAFRDLEQRAVFGKLVLEIA